MAINIDEVYIQTYEDTVRHLAQQMDAKLRGTTDERGVNSNKHNWETMGSTDAVQKTSARTPTPENDSLWGRRVSVAQTWHVGDTVEQEDIVQMLVDPNSNIAMSQGMAMKRATDDIIIAAATGDALLGDGSTLAFPAGQEIGDYSTPISFDFVTAVQERFMSNDIDPSIPKVAVIGPTQVRKLMQLTEQTSADYVAREALQRLNATGIVPNWMGFTWILSTRLLHPAAGQIDCLFYTRQAIGLQVNQDVTARVAEDPSISFAWRIYCHLTMGAVRVEDQQIVRGKLADTL